MKTFFNINSTLTKMSNKIAIIGLGYVGIPLAVEFGKLYPTVLDIKGIVNEPIWRL